MWVLKNFLIVCGAFYLSMWVLLPLPTILLATAVGVVTVLAIDTTHPSRWALLPPALFLERHVFAYRSWVIGPTTADYVGIAVEAALPAIACVLGAAIFEGRQKARFDHRQSSI